MEKRLSSPEMLQGRPPGKIATAMRKSARDAKLADSPLLAVNDAADDPQDYARYLQGQALVP